MTDIVKYIIARWAYSVGQPIMTDAEYTVLDRAMKAKYPQNPYCKRSWSSDPCPVALLKEFGYPSLIKAVVLSDKTESIPSLNSLIEVRTAYEAMHAKHSVSYKIDGWNIQASYYNGELINIQTRGRASDAMDASAVAPLLPKQIPEMGRVLVVMECSVPDAEFAWFKETFGVTSQRGAVSTALANPEKCLSHIAIHAHGVRCSNRVSDKFDLLKSWGFQVPMYAWVQNYQELMDQVKAFSDYKEQYGVPTDGLVVEGESTNALRICAWEEPIYRSFVTGYRVARMYDNEECYAQDIVSLILEYQGSPAVNVTTKGGAVMKWDMAAHHTPLTSANISAALNQAATYLCTLTYDANGTLVGYNFKEV